MDIGGGKKGRVKLQIARNMCIDQNPLTWFFEFKQKVIWRSIKIAIETQLLVTGFFFFL